MFLLIDTFDEGGADELDEVGLAVGEMDDRGDGGFVVDLGEGGDRLGD